MADYYVKLPPTGGGSSGVTSIDSITGAITLVQGAGIVITDNSPLPGDITIGATNTGTVTSVSVVSANGFSGTVANPTTAAAITIDTTVTGILYGNGTAVAAAVPANFPTLNQNTSGTAANITATTNSTITTLSALSLPGSQVSGNISGTASNITATSNSTLTSLPNLTSASSLATVGTITTGAWNGSPISGMSFITSGTTYTTPAGISANTSFDFVLIGGGAGGASANSASVHSSCGGSGGGVRLVISGLSPSTTYSLTIGSAGAGGASGAVGTAGGNTTLTIGATTYTAGGGQPAAAVTGPGGTGGSATNGTINIVGQQGGPSMGVFTSGGMGGGNSPWGWGLGGAGNGPSAAANGQNATGYGGGGSGSSSNGAPTGGNGTQGIISIRWSN